MTSRLGVKERHAVKSARVSSLKFLMLFINIGAFHGVIYVQIRNFSTPLGIEFAVHF